MLQSRGLLACIFIVSPLGLIAQKVSQDTSGITVTDAQEHD